MKPGNTFAVIGWADTTNTGVPWYIFKSFPRPEFNPNGTVTYLNVRYNNGVGPNQFPALEIGEPEIYGVPDIGYTYERLRVNFRMRIAKCFWARMVTYVTGTVNNSSWSIVIEEMFGGQH